jgi:hypothetical protein
MQDDFPHLAQEIVGPLLTHMGFVLAGIDNSVDEGGRKGSVLYYHGPDSKVQLYNSSREGEINAMIAPLEAPDEYGLYNRSHMWHYFNEFAEEPKLSLEELVEKLRGERDNFTTTPRWLEWIKNERVARYYELARSGILEKYGTG